MGAVARRGGGPRSGSRWRCSARWSSTPAHNCRGFGWRSWRCAAATRRRPARHSAELVERNPGYLPAWRNLVVAQARGGDLQGAQRTLTQALGRFPADPLLWTHQAILLRQEGRREEALESIRRAAALAPRDAALALREASLLAELGRGAEAAVAARRGLQLAPAPEIRAALEPLAR